MRAFTYQRATSPQDAAQGVLSAPDGTFIAGGTNLLDLMKLQVTTPQHVVDVTRLDLKTIDATADGGLRVGALVTNATLAGDPRIPEGLRRAQPCAAVGRQRPAPQQGHHRRQPAAAHALLLFL